MKQEEQAINHDEQFLARWAENDPANPKNFSPRYKIWVTAQMAMLAFVGSFGSSIITPAERTLAAEFHIGTETSVFVLSLFVLGYAFGPMFWAPLGEVYGRKVSMVPAIFVLGLFSIGSGRSKTTAALLVTRFFGGVFASAPISNASAAIGDFYDPAHRGIPMALMAACVVGGPCLAPVAGSAIVVNSHLGWRCMSTYKSNISNTSNTTFSHHTSFRDRIHPSDYHIRRYRRHCCMLARNVSSSSP